MLPFTGDQFLDVFERYNVSVWPAHLLLYAMAILAILLALQRKVDLSKTVSFILAVFWIWMGLVYHFWFFSVINRAAPIFAALFILQGILFVIAGVWQNNLRFRFTPNPFAIIGGAFLIYALIITKIGIPNPDMMGPFVGVVEILCGSLILVGLLTRLAAIPLIINMLVAILSTKIPILLGYGFWGFSL